MLQWLSAQIFGPRRVLSSCAVNTAGKITMATPHQWRLLLLDVRASVSFRLLGHVRRGTTQRRRNRRSASLKFFADVAFARPRGRCRRRNNEGDSAGTATSLNFFVAICLRRSRKQNATGRKIEADCVEWPTLPPGGQLRRTDNRGGPANAGARPIFSPSLASSRRGGSIPAERKPKRICPNGMFARSHCHH